MNRIFLAATAVICLAAAGCTSTETEPKIEQIEEVKSNRKKIDGFIKSYIPPEQEIPTVYAPEWKNNPDHKTIAALTKGSYTDLTIFTQAEKLKSVSLTYATGDVKKSFILNAASEKNKISLLCRDEEKVQDLFKIVAELPEVITMPKGLPPSMEDVVVREIYMIHCFLFNPLMMAKTASLDIIPMLNISKNTTYYARKEYNVNNRLCYRLQIQLRDMFGGGMLRFYVDGKNIVRIEIPTMALDVGAKSAFILDIDQYQSINGIQVPSSFVFRGERFLLKENKIGR